MLQILSHHQPKATRVSDAKFLMLHSLRELLLEGGHQKQVPESHQEGIAHHIATHQRHSEESTRSCLTNAGGKDAECGHLGRTRTPDFHGFGTLVLLGSVQNIRCLSARAALPRDTTAAESSPRPGGFFNMHERQKDLIAKSVTR